MFTSFCLDLLWPSKDIVTVEIPINAPDYTLPDGTVSNQIPIDLIICRKRDMKSLYSSNAYMKSFVSPLQARNFKTDTSSQNSLIVLGESEEAVNHVIDAQIGEILANFGENNVQEIHITDQKLFNNW